MNGRITNMDKRGSLGKLAKSMSFQGDTDEFARDLLFLSQSTKNASATDTHPLSVIVQNVKVGDLIFFRGNRWTSQVINKAQGLFARRCKTTGFSHVAIVAKIEGEGDSREVYILESTTNKTQIKDISGVVRSGEVQMVALKDRVESRYANGNSAYSRVAVRPLHNFVLTAEKDANFQKFIQESLGKPYERG
jgi:hypothetical protein